MNSIGARVKAQFQKFAYQVQCHIWHNMAIIIPGGIIIFENLKISILLRRNGLLSNTLISDIVFKFRINVVFDMKN